ncbi:cobalt ECF transporter T component CbiQ [Paenibacillus beijingensis]|uniref:Cobalt ABC transporter permease n=1 Tax=Paenibacillus beijingensis TaxID=1126833 RepID=A0A0D5NFC0_9BACL|nr:cobalt ECF transporter T component CbiQ [Paenibacillus beijingensis]AJY73840.1 cobalt ABC transporter permease [Paenibacillus beijingensis]
MIKSIDTLSYGNRFRSVSPMWKTGFAAVMVVLSYWTHPLVQAAIWAWMTIWTVYYAGIPIRFYFVLFGSTCLFFMMSLPAMLLEITRGGLSGAGDAWLLAEAFGWSLYVPYASVQASALAFDRIAACSACLFFVIFTTPVPELLQVLKRLRLPHLVVELMLLTYRFLFVLADTAYGMSVAQRSRGGHNGFAGTIRDIAILVVRLFGKAMQRYKGLSNGLISRGFVNEIHLAPYKSGRIPFRYKAEGCAGIAVLLALELLF